MAGPGGEVAGVALGAAVLLIATAHSLDTNKDMNIPFEANSSFYLHF